MPLESGTTISDLDKDWPLGSDTKSRGDDHLRLIKSVLKAQFPGASGNGYSSPITATEAELNSISGSTSNLQTQIDNLVASSGQIPTGTVMIFLEVVAPVGWVQTFDYGGAALIVANGTGLSGGGADNPIAWDVKPTILGHTLTENEMPRHSHTVNLDRELGQKGADGFIGDQDDIGQAVKPTNLVGGSAPHTHQALTLHFRPYHVAAISCRKT